MKKIHNAISDIKSDYLLDAINTSGIPVGTENGAETKSAPSAKKKSKFAYRTVLVAALFAAVGLTFLLSLGFLMYKMNPSGSSRPIPVPENISTASATPPFANPGTAPRTSDKTDETVNPLGTTESQHNYRSPVTYASSDADAVAASKSSLAVTKQEDNTGAVLFKITSVAELNSFTNLIPDNTNKSSDLPSVRSATDTYDEAYFKEKTLVIALVKSDSGSDGAAFSSYTVTKDSLNVDLTRSSDSSSKGANFIILEIPNTEISGVTEYKVTVGRELPDDTTPIETSSSNPNETKTPITTVSPDITTAPEETTGPVNDESYESSEGLLFRLNPDRESYSIIGYERLTLAGRIESNMIPEVHANEKRLYLPSSFKNLPVTVIAPNAFADCSLFNELIIPGTVRTVGQSAFTGCQLSIMYFIPADCSDYIGSKQLDYINIDKKGLAEVLLLDESTVEALCSTGAGFVYCPYYTGPQTYVLPTYHTTERVITPQNISYSASELSLINEARAALTEQYRAFSSIPEKLYLIDIIPSDNGIDTVTFEFCLGGLKTGCIFTYTKNIKTGESKCKETHTLFNTLYQYGITTELMNTITSDFTLRSGTHVTPSDLTLIVRDEKCCIAYSSPHSATTAPLYSYLVPNLPVSIYGTSS